MIQAETEIIRNAVDWETGENVALPFEFELPSGSTIYIVFHTFEEGLRFRDGNLAIVALQSDYKILAWRFEGGEWQNHTTEESPIDWEPDIEIESCSDEAVLWEIGSPGVLAYYVKRGENTWELGERIHEVSFQQFIDAHGPLACVKK